MSPSCQSAPFLDLRPLGQLSSTLTVQLKSVNRLRLKMCCSCAAYGFNIATSIANDTSCPLGELMTIKRNHASQTCVHLPARTDNPRCIRRKKWTRAFSE
jgi:hypothetical protein